MSYHVTAVPHPLKGERVAFAMENGTTLEDAVVQAAEQGEVPLRTLANSVVIVGDTLVAKEHWRNVRPKAGQTVAIKAVAADPATITLASVTTALVTAAIGVGLNLLLSLIFKPPKQSNRQADDPVDPRYTIQGVSNQARPYGPIAKIYGRRVNYFPTVATQPYTEVFWDENQYIRAVFDIGYGPLAISDIKVGDTPIEQLRGVTYEVRQGYPDDAPLTLFPSQVREEALNIELKYVSGFSVRRTEPDADSVSIDVTFPSGLMRISDRNIKFGMEVEFEVQYRLAGTTTWIAAPLESNHFGVYFLGAGKFKVAAKSKASVRRSVWFRTPSRAQYDVQVRRTTIDDQSDNVGDNQSVTTEQSFLTAVRSFTNRAPINKTGIARIAVRMQATDQLNGNLEQLNCTVQAILPVWNGSTWVDQQTRSPVWAFCDVLRGSANARPLAASRIDLAQMLAWDAQCTADGITLDAALEDVQSVEDRLRDIAATGNAALKKSGGLFSVALDNTKTMVVQHFSTRNSRNLVGTQVLVERPHGFKVRFPNELTLHQYDEVIAYEEGYSASNATKFEVLELPYTTSASQAWKRARRELFTRRLRPAVYSKETDIRHIVCEPGDLVRMTDDVALWGGSGARVKTLATSGLNTTGVTLDAPVTMEADKAYNLRVQMADGSSLVIPVDLDVGEVTALTFTTPVATASGPAVGNHVLFGEVGSESVELIVRSIEPLDDLGARITFEDYAPLIQTSATGAIPDFDAQITLPPVVNRAAPPLVRVVSIDSDEDVLIRNSDGTLTSRILVAVALDQTTGSVPAESIQVRYRPADTSQDWSFIGSIIAPSGEVSIMPVEDGASYEIAFRSVSRLGATSEYTFITHTVVGKTKPPPDVERFYRTGQSVTWPYPDAPIDLAGFLLRANYGTNADWGLARPLHPGVITAPPFSIADMYGTQTILIKAVDTSGIESLNAATVTIDLGDVLVSNVADTQSEAPSWAGELTGGTDTGTDIEASLVSSPPMYGAAAEQLYGAAADAFYESGYYDSLVYIARYTPDALYLGDGLLKLELTVVGDYAVDYRISTSLPFYGASGDPLYGSSGDPFYDASVVGEWTPWPGVLGPFETATDSYDIRLTVQPGAVQGACSQFDLITDLPDVVESLEDIVISSGSTRLPITKTYRVIKIVNVTVQTDGNGGISARVIDKSASLGPDTEVLNAAGTAVNGLVDAIIQGY